MKNGLLLKLELEEDIDFSYNDKDEIKSKGYIKRHLEVCGYSEKYSDLNSNIMDRWNMHTFSNVIISPSKISLIKLDNSYNCLDILLWMIKNNKLDIKVLSPYLYEFLDYYSLLNVEV